LLTSIFELIDLNRDRQGYSAGVPFLSGPRVLAETLEPPIWKGEIMKELSGIDILRLVFKLLGESINSTCQRDFIVFLTDKCGVDITSKILQIPEGTIHRLRNNN
jgi:hypothetical protein